MPPAVVRADYAELARMAACFAQQAEQSRRMLQRVRSEQATLQGGDWLGKGAQAFYAEMNGQVVPTLNRLVRAMEEAQRVTLQVSRLLKEAEDEAARCLRANGSGGVAGVGQASGAPGAAAGSPNGGGLAARAGQQVKGIGLNESVLSRSFERMSPMDKLRALDKLRSLPAVDYGDTVMDVLEAVAEYQDKMGRAGGLGKFLKIPAIEGFGKVVGYYDITKNSVKLLKDLYDGDVLKLENLQVAGDLVADVAGQFGPVGKAFNAGYAIGKFVDSKLGLSSKIADFFVDDSQTWSSRNLVHDYVQKYGSAADKAAYRQYRDDYRARAGAAAQAGQPVPPFQPPALPVFKKLDPAVLRLAATNRDINSVGYNLALANRSQSLPPMFRKQYFK